MQGRRYSKWLLGCFGALTVLGTGPVAAEHDSLAFARGGGELLAGSSAAPRWGVLKRGRIARARTAAGSAPMAGQVFGQCFYSVSPTSVSNVSAAGGSGSILVSWHYEPNPEFPDEEDASVCEENWGTSSGVTWISVRESETENDTANYTVSANTTSATRSGTITVAGNSITISQLAGTPPSCSVSATGGGQVGQAISLTGTLTPSDASAVFRWKATRMNGGQPVETHTPSEGASSSFTPGNAGRWVFGLTVQKPRGTNVATCTAERGVQASPDRPPNADAGSNQRVNEGVRVTLNGSGSSDPDNDMLTYRWRQTGGVSVSLNGATTARPSFTAPQVTTNTDLTFTLTVTARSLSDTDRVTVTVRDTPPCVFTVSPTTREVADDAGQYDVTVTASNASCSWSMSSQASWITVLTPSRTGSTTGTYRTASNTTPGSPQRTGTMTVAGHTVTITQRPGPNPPPSNPPPSNPPPSNPPPSNPPPSNPPPSSPPGRPSSILAPNRAPTAHAGYYQVVGRAETVTLSASRSSDHEPGELIYSWTQLNGPSVSIADADKVRATFLAPTHNTELEFSVSVTDRGLRPLTSYARVRVGVVEHSMTKLRDDLLRDWATRNKKGSDLCTAWSLLDATAREVFIWNTHRLRLSKALAHVDAMYTVAGRNPNGQCGGTEYNRTYMSMDTALHAKLLLAFENDRNALPPWERSTDFACWNPFGLGECPHWPFDRQIQTQTGTPRAQVQFFAYPGKITVRRTWIGWINDIAQGVCYERKLALDPADVCEGDCETSGPTGLCQRTLHYNDTVLTDPNRKYVPPTGGIPIVDPYSFEMDQDYEIDHDSAPSCAGMKGQVCATVRRSGVGLATNRLWIERVHGQPACFRTKNGN